MVSAMVQNGCTLEEKVLLEEPATQGVVLLKLNRPNKRNALSTDMYNKLTEALQRHLRAKTKVLILAGCGDCFCGGMDLKEILESPTQLVAAHRFMKTLATYTSILIAAIHGNCVGIGSTMLMHFDAVFAAENTSLATPFRSLGIAPEFASSVLFPLCLGPALTARMLYAGETVSAEEWHKAGAITAIAGSGSEAVLKHSIAFAVNLTENTDTDEWDATVLAKTLVKSHRRKVTLDAIEREFEELDRALASGGARMKIEARVANMTRRRGRL